MSYEEYLLSDVKRKMVRHITCQTIVFFLVRTTGIEPAQVALWDPKSHVSTNFTMSASKRSLILLRILMRILLHIVA